MILSLYLQPGPFTYISKVLINPVLMSDRFIFTEMLFLCSHPHLNTLRLHPPSSSGYKPWYFVIILYFSFSNFTFSHSFVSISHHSRDHHHIQNPSKPRSWSCQCPNCCHLFPGLLSCFPDSLRVFSLPWRLSKQPVGSFTNTSCNVFPKFPKFIIYYIPLCSQEPRPPDYAVSWTHQEYSFPWHFWIAIYLPNILFPFITSRLIQM